MKNLTIVLLSCFTVLISCKQKSNPGSDISVKPEYSEQVSATSNNLQSEIKIIPIEHATTVLEWEILPFI